MNENMITVSGNVIAEPELRQTKGGPMLTFRVASNHRYFNNRTGQWEEGVTNYYDVVAFRQLAVNTAESLHKGYGVYVQGQLRQRRYTRQDGSQGMSCEIAAKVVGPDLTFGVAQWMRRPRSQPAESAGQAGPGGQVNTAGPASPAGEDRAPWSPPSTGREAAGDLPDPERTPYVVARDHDPEESYGGLEVDEDGVIVEGPSGAAEAPEEDGEESAA